MTKASEPASEVKGTEAPFDFEKEVLGENKPAIEIIGNYTLRHPTCDFGYIELTAECTLTNMIAQQKRLETEYPTKKPEPAPWPEKEKRDPDSMTYAEHHAADGTCGHVNKTYKSGVSAKGPWNMAKCSDCGMISFNNGASWSASKPRGQ